MKNYIFYIYFLMMYLSRLEWDMNQALSEEIKTVIGIIQGDCLSAILFIFYLAIYLTPKETSDHNYYIISLSEIKWKYQDENKITISPKYVDDITLATNEYENIKAIKETIPHMLIEADLIVNEKT